MFTCHVHSATRVRDGFGNAGENRLPACSSRQVRNIDLQVCAPSGVALRFHASRKRTECPLGAQAAGLCSVPLAEKLFETNSSRSTFVAGKLPATAGWQPALPKLRSADKGIHFFGELFQRGRIGCGSVA